MIADIGTGTGAAAFCLLIRIPNIRIVGVEIQKNLADFAKYNCMLNNVIERFQVVVYNIFRPIEEIIVYLGSFSHVMSNPPFSIGTPSPNQSRSTAHTSINLRAWILRCLDFVQPHGSITLICQATILDQLLSILAGVIGGITIIPIWMHVNTPAKRCILHGYKNSHAPTILHTGLILHKGSNYTKEAENVLRNGQALQLQ